MPSMCSTRSYPSSGQRSQNILAKCNYRPRRYGVLEVDVLCSEALYESNDFPKPARDVAALLASKVYYLGEYEEALSFALGAGSAFQNEGRTPGSEEYIETIVCACSSRPPCLIGSDIRVMQPTLLIAISRPGRTRRPIARRSTRGCRESSRVSLRGVFPKESSSR
jgi:hypothetical protein